MFKKLVYICSNHEKSAKKIKKKCYSIVYWNPIQYLTNEKKAILNSVELNKQIVIMADITQVIVYAVLSKKQRNWIMKLVWNSS